jgi:hypothetical protein
MYRRLWIAGFVFVALLGVQNPFFPNKLLAGWCGCGNCMMSITNPGSCSCSPPYYWCLEDLLALQLQASLHTNPSETTAVPTFAKSDLTNNVVYLVSGGQCLHSKNVLHLLGSTRDEMKFIPVRFD